MEALKRNEPGSQTPGVHLTDQWLGKTTVLQSKLKQKVLQEKTKYFLYEGSKA